MSKPNAKMITIVFSPTVFEEQVEAFKKVIARATELSRADDGCLTFEFYQQQDDPRHFVLLEQWRDQEALESHLVDLVNAFGPARPDSSLPAAILDMCESVDANLYDPVA